MYVISLTPFYYCLQESVRALAEHFVESYYHLGFGEVTYVKTFSQLKNQFDSRPGSADQDDGGASSGM